MGAVEALAQGAADSFIKAKICKVSMVPACGFRSWVWVTQGKALFG